MNDTCKKIAGFMIFAVVVFPALAWGTSLKGQVKECCLDNGMKVLILERHYAPVVSFYMRFNVGAVDEPGGETGTAHLLEHMLFKGTETLGTTNYREEKKVLEEIDLLAGRIDGEMKKEKSADERKIAEWRAQLETLQKEHQKWVVKDEISLLYGQNGADGLNASTGYDLTTYQVNLPANRIELWARIESDRMSHPVLREFYSEKEVVREERRQREETDPDGKLMENFLTMTFVAHPYGRPIVGWDTDLMFLTRKKVEHFFRSYYCPNNAVVAVVGDVVPEEVMTMIKKYFGKISPQEIPARTKSEEPIQSGERRVEVVFEANPKVLIGYHKPTLPHFDDYVFDIIDLLLSHGRTSRLYKTLVEGNKLAVEVSTANGIPGSRYPNLFVISAIPRNPHTCKELEQEIEREIERLKKEAVDASELTKVKNQLEADFIRSLASNAGLASQLSYFQVVAGDWRYLEEHLKVVERISAEDIMAVARKYLNKENRTVATLVKEEHEP